jgi:exodeoxyribonuclease V gamma subunit
VLSYVSRDALTGDARSPSSVIQELAAMLERGYLPKEALDRRRQEGIHPLRRFDERYFPELTRPRARPPVTAPAARREAQARALGRSLRAVTGPPDLARLRAELPPETWTLLAERLGLWRRPTGAARFPDGRVALSFAALRGFLECPLQGAARFVLGMAALTDDDEDPTALRDEAFATPHAETVLFLREVLLEALARGQLVREVYERRALHRELRGEHPTGVFGEAERRAHLRTLADWQALVGPLAAPPRTLRFGRADEHAAVDVLHAPLTLAVPVGERTLTVELYGKSEPLVDSGAASLSLVKRKIGNAEPTRRAKEALRGFLDHVVLSAAQLSAGAHRGVVAIADPLRPQRHEARFAPIAATEARAYLATVVGDLLNGSHAYLLPCEAVFELARTPDSVERVVDGLRESGRGFSSLYGPVPHAERFPPPPEAEARAAIERRFGLFFRARRDGGTP